jgi:hypothetical protein
MNTKKSEISQNGGFIKTIIILIIILVVIGLSGLDAGNIWIEFFEPAFTFVGNLIVSVSNFVINLVQYGLAIFKSA